MYLTGLTSVELQTELHEIHLIRIAVRLTAAELHPLAAGLLGNIGLVIEKTAEDFPELRQSDRSFIIMTEWRKKLQKCPSVAQIVLVFEEMKMNKHIICLVCTLHTQERTRSAYEFSSLSFQYQHMLMDNIITFTLHSL